MHHRGVELETHTRFRARRAQPYDKTVAIIEISIYAMTYFLLVVPSDKFCLNAK